MIWLQIILFILLEKWNCKHLLIETKNRHFEDMKAVPENEEPGNIFDDSINEAWDTKTETTKETVPKDKVTATDKSTQEGVPEWSGQCVADYWDEGPNVDVAGLFVNSPANCVARCKVAGYLFAGLYSTNRCACKNEAPPSNKILPADQCNEKCGGDPTQICGGAEAMSVYRTGAKDRTCRESFICTKDQTCFWAPSDYENANAGCRCNDKTASLPDCANPNCPTYCARGSQCMKKNDIWDCHCLPSFKNVDISDFVKGKCVKKQECKKPGASVGAVGIAVDNTRGDCGLTATNTLRLKKELAISIARELEGLNVPRWTLVTFTVAKPKTEDTKKNTKLVTDTTDIKELITSINGINCTEAWRWGQAGASRVMQGIKRVLENMPKGGTVIVITENQSYDLDRTEELLRLKEERELNILFAMSPRYHGTQGDSSWKKYIKLSNSHIYQMDKLERKAFTSAVRKEVENTCDPIHDEKTTN